MKKFCDDERFEVHKLHFRDHERRSKLRRFICYTDQILIPKRNYRSKRYSKVFEFFQLRIIGRQWAI